MGTSMAHESCGVLLWRDRLSVALPALLLDYSGSPHINSTTTPGRTGPFLVEGDLMIIRQLIGSKVGNVHYPPGVRTSASHAPHWRSCVLLYLPRPLFPPGYFGPGARNFLSRTTLCHPCHIGLCQKFFKAHYALFFPADGVPQMPSLFAAEGGYVSLETRPLCYPWGV